VEFADFGLCDYNHAVYDPVDLPSLLADATLPGDRQAARRLRRFIDQQADRPRPGAPPIVSNARRARMRFPRIRQGSGPIGPIGAPQSSRLICASGSIQRRRLAKKGAVAFPLVKTAGDHSGIRHLRVSRRPVQTGHPGSIDNAAVFSFYRDMAVKGAVAGFARTYCLYLHDDPIAVEFGLSDQRKFLLLLLGCDLKRSRDSPSTF
jgi:CelD/BcsL family acetyltransferase involved in cellulose biosynthesis